MFERYTEKARRVDEIIAQIASASQEQSQGISQLNSAVRSMDNVTQKNAANAEESASASEELSGQAETMKSVVGQLRALVGGNARDVSRGTPGGRYSRAQLASAPAVKKEDHSRSLAALQNRLAGKRTVRPMEPAPVAAGKPDRSALPLDDDFKEF